MPRVVPSQIVDIIDQIVPEAKGQIDTQEKRFSIGRDRENSVAAIVDLVDQIPSELLVLPSEQYAMLVASIAALKTVLKTWKLRDYGLDRIPGFGNLNPITHIRNALSSCPDEFPAKDTSELTFISDTNFRKNLEIDISATNKALANGEWKAATVLAGSVIEALLLWAINQRDDSEIEAVKSKLVKDGTLNKSIGNKIEKWSLHSFIEVAIELNIISLETAQQTRLAKEFRNLIHAGREIRLKQRCDRGTALSAVAAVEHVVRDLTM